MKNIMLLLAAVPLVLLAACTPEAPEPSPTPAPTPSPMVTAAPAPEAPVWQDQVFEKEYRNGDGAKLLYARFLLPGIAQAGGNDAWGAINDYYKTEGESYLATADESAALAEGDYDVQTSLGYDFTPYAMESYYSVSCQSDALISVRRTYYSNLGTAYPATFQFSEQFDAATGSMLTFADFFSDPAAAKVLILDAIRTQLGQREDAEAFDPSKVETAFREDYFYLTSDSLVFYFQPDDLAPHAAGVPEFPIPRTDFGELLTR